MICRFCSERSGRCLNFTISSSELNYLVVRTKPSRRWKLSILSLELRHLVVENSRRWKLTISLLERNLLELSLFDVKLNYVAAGTQPSRRWN